MKYTVSASEHTKVSGHFYGYAWFITEEGQEIAVAYKAGRKNMLVTDPIWNWIKKERTAEQQKYIEANINALQQIFA